MKYKAFMFPYTMQAASACSRPGGSLRLMLKDSVSFHSYALLSFPTRSRNKKNQMGTDNALLALLLLSLPFAFTFAKLVALPELAEAVHQFARRPVYSRYPLSPRIQR